MTDDSRRGPGDAGLPPGETQLPKRRRRTRDEVLRQELSAYQVELERRNEELRRTQIALEASRVRYEDLYARAPVGLVTVGPQSRILSLNERAAHMLRVPVHGTSYRRLSDFMSSESFGTYERHRAQLFVAKGDATIELEMRREGGSPFWAELLMTLAREEIEGTLVCKIALTDITERKRLRDEVAHFAAIVESADQAILSEDLEGRITTWNPGAQRLFGYSSFEAIGHEFDMLIPPETMKEEKRIRGRVRYGDTITSESQWRHRDGRRVHVYRASARIQADGHVVGISHIVQDITAQVESRQEVARLLRDLREADRRKDDFIATLAHELRNPLAPIRNAAAVLRYAMVDPKVQWCRDVIDRQVRHMSALLEDLLDVSRLTRDMIRLHRERVELGTVIVQAVEATRPLFEARRHKLTLDLPMEPIEVEGDVNRLIQIFANLLNNAGKYTDPEGEIRCVAERVENGVVVRIRDTGIGIQPENVARIFDLFSQVSPAAQGAEGLGIGLALVKGLVERHGGSVAARSAGLGKGSEFLVTLPLTSAAPPPLQRIAPPRQPGETSSRRRVLVVDDNVDAAESLAVILRFDGHEVRTAHDGEHAIQAAGDFRPQVVLLDLGMPKLDGYEVARRLRAKPWGRDLVLVACTGWGQPEDLRRSKEAGFDHHLVKPVSPDAVLGVVAASPEASRS